MELLRNWLEENYSNSQLKTDEMVALANMSRTNFYNRLNDLTGLTPDRFLQDFRLKKAVALLENSDRSIMEIATMTGFGNALNITRAFKQRMGLTPENYREQHFKLGKTSSQWKGGAKPTETPGVPVVVEDETDDFEIIED